MEPFPQLHLPVQKAYATHSLYMVCFTNNTRGTSQKFLRLSHISHWPQNLTEVLCFFVSWEILQLAAGKNKFQNSRKALPSPSIQKLYWYQKKRKKKKFCAVVPQEGAFFHFNKVSEGNGKPNIPPSASLHQCPQEPSRAKQTQVPHFSLAKQLLDCPWSLPTESRYFCT